MKYLEYFQNFLFIVYNIFFCYKFYTYDNGVLLLSASVITSCHCRYPIISLKIVGDIAELMILVLLILESNKGDAGKYEGAF